MSLTRSESDARDLTQQTFFVWATKGHQLRDRSKTKSWLYTTLHRAFLKSRRKEIRCPQSELDEASNELPVFTPEFANRLDFSQVLSALAQVDEVYQAAVSLFYLEDYAYADIAAVLEVPIGTVKSRIARGIAQLRKIFLRSVMQGANTKARKRSSSKNVPRHLRTSLINALNYRIKNLKPGKQSGTEVPFLSGNELGSRDS